MIQNMRDLGGIKTRDGKTVKPGLLIRSAHLCQAEESDLSGVSAVIDLRTPMEMLEAPDQIWGRDYFPMPIFEDMNAGISHEKGVEEQGFPDIAMLYGKLMEGCVSSFSSVLKAIMAHDFSTGAVLWHCTEGKDRCGMTTALVLEMLGVDRDAILQDYLKTNIVNLPKAIRIREALIKTKGEKFAQSVYRAHIADEGYIRSAWRAMGENYFQKMNISDEEIKAFQSKVLA